MKKENKNEVIHIRVDKWTKDKLQQMADNQQRKLSDFIRLLLEKEAGNKIPKKVGR